MSEDSPGLPIGFAAGSRIAGYRLEEQIGQGGMAVVFRAHDERLDRQVALKILAPALAADIAFRQRFIRESRAAAAVDDPHIIPVFEAGEASGVLFIAMRLVRGGDMRSLVQRTGLLPPGRIAEIVSQVASALDAAHDHGLVHRDVKPANMLLGVTESPGRPDHVYLSDFGLSKGSLEVSGLTGTGTFLGTLDYVSPEQIAGRPVDGRADQYALACTAFELLTGEPPFARDEATAVMYAQLSEPPPSVRSSRPDLPAAVDSVFARALAKSPAHRFANCREFANALRQALGLPTYHSGPGSFGPPDRPQTEIAGPPAAPGGSSGAAGAGLSGVGTQAWPGPGPLSDAGHRRPAGPGTPPRGASGPPGYAAGPGYAAEPRTPPGGASGPPGYAAEPGTPPTRVSGAPGYAAGPGTPPTGASAAPGYPPGPGYGAGSGTSPTEARPQPQPQPSEPRSTTPGLTEQAGSPAGWAGEPPVPGRGSRSRWPAVIAVGLVVLVAAGGSVAFIALHHKPAPTLPKPHKHSHPLIRTVSLSPPQCGTATGSGRSFGVTPAGSVTVPSPPYGAIVTADLNYTFIALPSAIEVLRNRGGIPASPAIRTIPIPDHPHAQAITSNGQYLVTATDHGATVISVSAAERPGSGTAVVGRLVSGLPGNPGGDDLALSTDNRFVFIAMRYANKIAVFNLAMALRDHFGPSDLVGYSAVGIKPHGMAVSANGQWLYVTSRFAQQGSLEGMISVLSVRKAEVHPARSKVSSAIAGCGAYRVIASPDGSVLWVIAQASNYLVGFSASKLLTDPSHALIAKVAIGATPLDEVLVNSGTRILITDNAGSDLAVVNPATALAGKKNALIGYVPTTALPRFFAFEPDGPVLLLVTGGSSEQVQAIRTDDLP